jgi:CRISPR-associated endonuclease/helicase Cas3
MIVLNTISSSKKTYQYIRNELAKKFGEPNITENGIAEFPNIILIYLSSNIIPKHRFERIKSINNKELNKRKIIVSTQVIEAGIDISVDEIYRDFAPLDSIIQTSGRCNRHNEKSSGIVNIYYLKDEKDDKFSHKIYDILLLEVTEEILKYYHTIKEKDFNLKVIPEYYRKVRSRGKQINLVEPVKNLRFSIIEESFKLIEEEVYKRDVFVVINEEAKKILNEIDSVLEMKDIYKRREELLKRRKDFFNYVISIDHRNSKYVQETKGKIPYIGKEYYDLETGLSVEDEETLII